jgi:hypothetical protein
VKHFLIEKLEELTPGPDPQGGLILAKGYVGDVQADFITFYQQFDLRFSWKIPTKAIIWNELVDPDFPDTSAVRLYIDASAMVEGFSDIVTTTGAGVIVAKTDTTLPAIYLAGGITSKHLGMSKARPFKKTDGGSPVAPSVDPCEPSPMGPIPQHPPTTTCDPPNQCYSYGPMGP